jgi:hypothetical protein
MGRLRSVAIAGVFVLLCVPGVAAGSVSPLPRSDYTVRAVCAKAARGRAGCLALQLVPRTAAARARRHPLGLIRSAPLMAAFAGRGGVWPEAAGPEEATGWGLEISLDIEVAHATCESCEILLVEAGAPSYEDLSRNG